MAKTIIFVDDDKQTMPFYVQALKFAQYEVKHFANADLALKTIDSEKLIVDLWVIDVTMPPGSYDLAKTENGILTGLYFAVDLRNIYPETPIILFSASPLPPVTKHARALARKLSRCSFVPKLEYPPHKLVEYVDYFFAKGRFKEGGLRKLYDSLILEPNFSGVGIDIKKLIDK